MDTSEADRARRLSSARRRASRPTPRNLVLTSVLVVDQQGIHRTLQATEAPMRIDLCGTSVTSITHECAAQSLTLHLGDWNGADAAQSSASVPAGSVVFEGVAAYHLEHAMSTNLVEGIHEIDAADFVREYTTEFPTMRAPWPELPTVPESIDGLIEAIRNAGLHAYVLESAWGLEGWLMAKSMKRAHLEQGRSSFGTGTIVSIKLLCL